MRKQLTKSRTAKSTEKHLHLIFVHIIPQSLLAGWIRVHFVERSRPLHVLPHDVSTKVGWDGIALRFLLLPHIGLDIIIARIRLLVKRLLGLWATGAFEVCVLGGTSRKSA